MSEPANETSCELCHPQFGELTVGMKLCPENYPVPHVVVEAIGDDSVTLKWTIGDPTTFTLTSEKWSKSKWGIIKQLAGAGKEKR